jgi:hypothetical protein
MDGDATMNVRQGLWRTWIFVTVLWVIGTATVAWFVVPQNVAGKYQYVYNIRKDVALG